MTPDLNDAADHTLSLVSFCCNEYVYCVPGLNSVRHFHYWALFAYASAPATQDVPHDASDAVLAAS